LLHHPSPSPRFPHSQRRARRRLPSHYPKIDKASDRSRDSTLVIVSSLALIQMRDRYSCEPLLTLWNESRLSADYHAENTDGPWRFSIPGLSKTAVMIRNSLAADNPLRTLPTFRSKTDMKHQLERKLTTHGLQAVLPQFQNNLAMDDSQKTSLTKVTQKSNVDKELRDDSPKRPYRIGHPGLSSGATN